jgi:hypothetical protein
MAKKTTKEPSMSDVLAAINGLTNVVGQLVQQKQNTSNPTDGDFEDETGVIVPVKPQRGRSKKNQSTTSKAGPMKISPTLGKPRINKFEEMAEKNEFTHEIDKRKWKPKERGPMRSIKYNCVKCGKEEYITRSMIGPNGEYKCSSCVGRK